MKNTMIVLLMAVIVTMFVYRKPNTPHTVTVTETIVVRDTVRDTIREPVISAYFRTDTIWAERVRTDTLYIKDSVLVYVPIERKEYRTNQYHAIIDGYKVNLVKMDVFRDTYRNTVMERTRIVNRPKFGVGIQVGYGVGPNANGPYIGAGLQYNLFTF